MNFDSRLRSFFAFGVERQRASIACMLVTALAFVPRPGVGDELTCGSLKNAFGPFDYRDPQAQGEPLGLVESAHFTPDIENLVKGLSGTLPQELDYTLRAFPNHPRALYSVSRYAAAGMKPALRRSIDCYFDRARRMAPDDPMVLVIKGIYLSKVKRAAESIKAYNEALALDPQLVEAHYNLGLELARSNQFAKANQHAQIAYRMGYPLPGLRQMLQRHGAWQPLTDAANANPAAPAPAAGQTGVVADPAAGSPRS